MTAGNNYEELLEEVCDKLDNLDSAKEIDVLDIKSSVEAIENLMTDTQAKLNFQEIKEKLENIAMQVDNCNDALLKDLYNDLNALKNNTSSVSQHLENLQNIQNLALTSAEFEEYQKQQLDLALKTNENIFNEIKTLREKAQTSANPENIKKLETQLESIHNNLTAYVETIVSKVELIPGVEEIGSVVSDLNSVQQKSIKQTNALIKDVEAKLINFKADFDKKDFSDEISKISSIYDSLNMINAWIEKVGYINQAIENVYSRLGENIDFDDVSEKVDIIYDNVTALNHWTMKIDKFDDSITEIQSKVASLTEFMTGTKNFANIMDAIREHITNTDKIDLEDISNKMDVVYDNLSALNQWANKVDSIDSKMEGFQTLNDKMEEEAVISKIDVVYDNISLLNEWVEKIDGLSQRSEELDEKYNQTSENLNSKIDEITENLTRALNIVEDVPNLKDKLEDLSGELNCITSKTKNDTDSYIYTLLDIESDFLKLHKFVDDKTNMTSQDINALKERFAELNDDISSISIRTNKLILSADDANKEFKEQLEVFKNSLQQFDLERQQFNPEVKFAMLADKVNQMANLIQDTTTTARNLNNAFLYLADWVDASGNILNSLQTDVSELRNDKSTTVELKIISDEITSVLNRTKDIEAAFEKYKKEDIPVLNEAVSYVITKLDELSEKQTNENSADFNSLINELSPVHDEIANVASHIEVAREDIELVKSAMTVLADGMDSVNNEMNTVKDEVGNINETVASFVSEAASIKEDVATLKNSITEIQNTIEDFKNDDISELKSSLTGVMVQMNTALTPDIDSLNARIDTLADENQKAITKFEELVDEKLSAHEQKINSLEEKVDFLSSKFDKLIDVMSEENKDNEIKDILNYLVTQITSSNEGITTNQQANGKTLTAVAEKLSSFDENINKIVSYIEED